MLPVVAPHSCQLPLVPFIKYISPVSGISSEVTWVSFSAARGHPWTPRNRRPEKLHDSLKELEVTTSAVHQTPTSIPSSRPLTPLWGFLEFSLSETADWLTNRGILCVFSLHSLDVPVCSLFFFSSLITSLSTELCHRGGYLRGSGRCAPPPSPGHPHPLIRSLPFLALSSPLLYLC